MGVYYGATYMEAQLCEGEDVIVVGGGNSAGRRRCISRRLRNLYMLVRSSQLADTMSRYLIRRIEENPAIQLHYNTEITSLEGDTQLERVSWQNKETGERSTHNIRYLFIMTGAFAAY